NTWLSSTRTIRIGSGTGTGSRLLGGEQQRIVRLTARVHVELELRVVLLQPREHAVERSEEHTSELQSPYDLVCRLLLEKKSRPVQRVVEDREAEHPLLRWETGSRLRPGRSRVGAAVDGGGAVDQVDRRRVLRVRRHRLG